MWKFAKSWKQGVSPNQGTSNSTAGRLEIGVVRTVVDTQEAPRPF